MIKLIPCPDCAGAAITPKGYDCLTCFGSGKVQEGVCPRCYAKSLEPICESCSEMLRREVEAISFIMSPSVVK